MISFSFEKNNKGTNILNMLILSWSKSEFCLLFVLGFRQVEKEPKIPTKTSPSSLLVAFTCWLLHHISFSCY